MYVLKPKFSEVAFNKLERAHYMNTANLKDTVFPRHLAYNASHQLNKLGHVRFNMDNLFL